MPIPTCCYPKRLGHRTQIVSDPMQNMARLNANSGGPNTSQWNIICIGYEKDFVQVGHVAVTWFVLLMFGPNMKGKYKSQVI